MSQFIEMFGGLCQDTPWSDVVTITNGKAYPEEYQEEGAYPICGSGGIMCYGEKKLCNGNTTILGRKGNINNPIFMESGYWIVDTAFSIDVDKAKLHPKFFYYWCCQYDFTKLNKQGVLPSLTRKDLEKVKMAIPQMRDQLKFVSIAEQADKSKFGDFKSQFIEMFKGDNQVPLGDICNIEKGATITRNDVLPGEVPVVAGGQEPSCYHNVANREAGAITVSASGAYAGYINFWNCPIFASDCNTIISKDDEKTDQTFVYFGLRAMQKQIYGLQKGGAQPHVYGKDLQKFMFPCPSYAKQIEFSKMAKQADKSKSVIQKALVYLNDIQSDELGKIA
ncbi:restriction endonuclease subunit S [Bacteroides uniformis]|uniref:restriction endonuclease subunit S n=1 Tax=Bacteroides uniformis TaxID=820 RepID=UPI002030ABB6|nr:restriction endonuclease subunit S [Bacteroides uniformis]MCM1956706.1 restriction endonuclease subunit S [Bacteroides uniformis]